MMLRFFHSPAINRFVFCQISESGLIEILEKVSQQTEKKTTVTVSSSEMSNVFDSFQSLVCHTFVITLCLADSSTDGGYWTRMMRMTTNFEQKPWNEPRVQEEVKTSYVLLRLLSGSLTGVFFLTKYWHVSFYVSLELTH